ncbi:MAG: BTAD domain-containing putative transcriptional regulator [Acidimicrobiales bacterium]
MGRDGSEFRCHVLGDLGVSIDGSAARFRGQRSLDVLALLIINRNRVLSTERIVDELWDDRPPRSARSSLHRFVFDVRKGLDHHADRLVTERTGYRLLVADDELDLARVERRLASLADAADPAGLDGLRHAIASLHAPIYDGSAALRSVTAEVYRIDELRLRAMHQTARLADALGTGIDDDLSGWHRLYPHDERLACHLAAGLDRSGRPVEALRVCTEFRTRLRDDLGLRPGPELDRVETSILQRGFDTAPSGDTTAERQSPAETSAAAAARQMAPPDATLIGREELVETVREALRTDRLVTLTGLGGVGKTTLAMHLAAGLGAEAGGPSRVALARLDEIESSDDLVPAIADALSLGPTGPDRPLAALVAEIRAVLATEPCLVVIDNAEDVAAALATLVDDLLTAPGPGRMLVTSRERLGSPRERVVTVPPLELPGGSVDASDAAAVRLFARRVAAITDLDPAEVAEDPATAAICRLVDGLPLAIELAAAQMSILRPDELLVRLRTSHDALGSKNGLARHSSLRTVLEGSWRTLTDVERSLLAELSIHAGFGASTVDFLEPAAGLRALKGLVDKSLVSVRRDGPGSVRFTLLETVRHFAREQLEASGGLAAAQERHAAWMIAFATEATLVETLIDAAITSRLFAERANLTRALGWLRLHGTLADYARLLSHSAGSIAHHGSPLELHEHYVDAVGRADAARGTPQALPDDDHGALLVAAADVALAVGDLGGAVQLGFDAVALIGDRHPDWAPGILCLLAVLTETAAVDQSGAVLLERAEAIAPHTRSATLNCAQTAVWRGQYELCDRNLERAIGHFEAALALDPRPGRVLLLAEIGIVCCLVALGRHDEARHRAESMRSMPGTDLWHYLVDIVAAMAIGTIDPTAGAARLEAAAGPGDTDFVGYADDAQIAAAVLAWHAGDADLCRRLLIEPMGRSPIFVLLLVEYRDGRPAAPASIDEWRERWRDTLRAHFDATARRSGSWVNSTPTAVEVARGIVRSGLGAATGEPPR